MSTFFVEDMVVHIPTWVVDLPSFRRWAHSDEFPETGRICYLNSDVWVDMSKEQVFSHNQVKNEFALTLGGLVKAGRLCLENRQAASIGARGSSISVQA